MSQGQGTSVQGDPLEVEASEVCDDDQRRCEAGPTADEDRGGAQTDMRARVHILLVAQADEAKCRKITGWLKAGVKMDEVLRKVKHEHELALGVDTTQAPQSDWKEE